jgi:CDP-diacylglycerol--glycerol-3-phosphate 3-phosphatidyltransferase
MDDTEFLRAFLRGWSPDIRFGHLEHLRIAWLVIDRHGPELAAEIVGERLKAMAVAQGKAPLYNETMTRFWIRLITHVHEATGSATIEEAIERVPMLLDKNVPLRHWSRTVMFGPEARIRWVEPDVMPLTI